MSKPGVTKGVKGLEDEGDHCSMTTQKLLGSRATRATTYQLRFRSDPIETILPRFPNRNDVT